MISAIEHICIYNEVVDHVFFCFSIVYSSKNSYDDQADKVLFLINFESVDFLHHVGVIEEKKNEILKTSFHGLSSCSILYCTSAFFW